MNKLAPIAAVLDQPGLRGRPGAIGMNEKTLRDEIGELGGREQAEVLAKKLETTFMNLMLDAMRKTVPEGGAISSDSFGGKAYRQMLDAEYAQVASENWDFGFHEALVRQIYDPDGSKSRKASEAEKGKFDSQSTGPVTNSSELQRVAPARQKEDQASEY